MICKNCGHDIEVQMSCYIHRSPVWFRSYSAHHDLKCNCRKPEPEVKGGKKVTLDYCEDCGCPLDVCCGNKKSRKESCVEVLHEHRKAEEKKFLKLAKGDKKLAFKLWLLDGYRKKGARKPSVAYFGGFKAQKGGKVNKHIRLCLKSGDKCNEILLKNK